MTIIDIVQIISAVLLIASILLQNRGAGLSATFGGEGNVYRTKRGLERYLFIATIILSVIFLATALANIIW
jgi:preprotein translocase subunit SecG